MNIVFLTSKAAHHYYLINELNKHYPVKTVFLQTQHLRRTTWPDRFRRWKKVGNIQASFKGVLNRILFGFEGALEVNYEKQKFFNGMDPFLEPSISFREIPSFNDFDAVEEIKKQEPDIIVVFGTEILKGEILKVAKMAILNIHRGILPGYRGGGVSEWALYNKDYGGFGVTIHICTDRLDGGDIVGQKIYNLQKDDGLHTLRYKTTMVALDVLKDVLKRYKDGTVEYKKQGAGRVWTSRDLTIVKKIIARRNLREHIKM